MKKLIIFVLPFNLAACVSPLTSDGIRDAKSKDLCWAYGAQAGPDYLNPEIRDELVRRGHAQCTDPNLLAMQQRQAAQNLQIGLQVLRDSNPSSPAIKQGQTCVSQVIGRQLVTQCN